MAFELSMKRNRRYDDKRHFENYTLTSVSTKIWGKDSLALGIKQGSTNRGRQEAPTYYFLYVVA